MAGATDFSFDTRYGYDDAGRRGLTEHTRKGELSSFVSYAYNYDPASRIDSITTKYDKASVPAFLALPASRTRSFGFDDSGQLKTRSTDGQQDNSFAYDENGNRIDANDEAHSNMANNRLESDGEFNYEYDNEGNLTSRTSQSDSSHTDYTWDNGNRLTQIQQYGSAGSLAKTITYRYNNDDLRVRKQVDVAGTSTGDFIEHYVYDGSQLVLTLDDAGIPKHRYTNGVGVDSLLVDEVFAAGAVDKTLWAANDHQGSVRELLATDANHTVVEHRDYDPFGELDVLYDQSGTQESGTAALDSAFAFAGREWDEEAQLYYNRARYYDPNTARFLGEDPALSDPNLYRYAGNDPVNFRDPSGLFSFGDFGFSDALGSFSFGELGFANGFLDGTAGFSIDVGALFKEVGSLFNRNQIPMFGLSSLGFASAGVSSASGSQSLGNTRAGGFSLSRSSFGAGMGLPWPTTFGQWVP